MLAKIAGVVLLFIGAVLAFKMVLGILMAILSVALVAVLLYFGWRLLHR